MLENTATPTANDGGVSWVLFLIPIVANIAFFTWLSVVGYASQRRRERESFHRHKLQELLVEKGELSGEQLRAEHAQERRQAWRARREALKLAGVVITAAGIGMLITLRGSEDSVARASGWIPLLVGAVVFLYAWRFFPKIDAGDES